MSRQLRALEELGLVSPRARIPPTAAPSWSASPREGRARFTRVRDARRERLPAAGWPPGTRRRPGTRPSAAPAQLRRPRAGLTSQLGQHRRRVVVRLAPGERDARRVGRLGRPDVGDQPGAARPAQQREGSGPVGRTEDLDQPRRPVGERRPPPVRRRAACRRSPRGHPTAGSAAAVKKPPSALRSPSTVRTYAATASAGPAGAPGGSAGEPARVEGTGSGSRAGSRRRRRAPGRPGPRPAAPSRTAPGARPSPDPSATSDHGRLGRTRVRKVTRVAVGVRGAANGFGEDTRPASYPGAKRTVRVSAPPQPRGEPRHVVHAAAHRRAAASRRRGRRAGRPCPRRGWRRGRSPRWGGPVLRARWRSRCACRQSARDGRSNARYVIRAGRIILWRSGEHFPSTHCGWGRPSRSPSALQTVPEVRGARSVDRTCRSTPLVVHSFGRHDADACHPFPQGCEGRSRARAGPARTRCTAVPKRIGGNAGDDVRVAAGAGAQLICRHF